MYKLSSTKLALIAFGAAVLGGSQIAILHHGTRAVPAIFDIAQERSHKTKVDKYSGTPAPIAPYGPPKTLATIANPNIDESSGIVASRTTPGVFWTHNDSGDGPYIYAFDNKGATKGVWKVSGAKARDWEAIAAGPGPQAGRNYLYIGDIGDNDEKRSEIVVYRIPEPTVTDADRNSTPREPNTTEAAEVIRLKYPDRSYDAEALLVHPLTGDLYIVTKESFVNPHVFESTAPLSTNSVTTLRLIGVLHIPTEFGGMITDGAISSDARRVVLCDYVQGYELDLGGLKADFNEIWKQPLAKFDLGKRDQGEAISYTLDGNAVVATSEGRPTPLIEVVRR